MITTGCAFFLLTVRPSGLLLFPVRAVTLSLFILLLHYFYLTVLIGKCAGDWWTLHIFSSYTGNWMGLVLSRLTLWPDGTWNMSNSEALIQHSNTTTYPTRYYYIRLEFISRNRLTGDFSLQLLVRMEFCTGSISWSYRLLPQVSENGKIFQLLPNSNVNVLSIC